MVFWWVDLGQIWGQKRGELEDFLGLILSVDLRAKSG
jgi:hypothetical protein